MRLRGLFRRDDERAGLWRARGHEVVIGSLSDEAALERLVAGADAVLHLAARRGKDDLTASRSVNVEASVLLARTAAAAGVGRLVYVSTISVYAETVAPDGLITEEVTPTGIERLNAYSRTKYEGECALRELSEAGEAPGLTVVRPTNVYGPGGRAWVLDWVARLRRLPVVPGGNAEIDVIHVDDVARGLLLAASAPSATGETLHFGHETVRLADFARGVAQAAGLRAYALPEPLDLLVRAALEYGHRLVRGSRRSTPLLGRRRFSHERARSVLAFTPQISLERGLRHLAEWFGGGCPDPRTTVLRAAS